MSRTLALLALLAGLSVASPAAASPVEDYAPYQPQTRCAPKAKPGTVALGEWLVRRFGGGSGPISRECGPGTSEHKEGRAFDWMLDATRKADRQRARAFLERAFRADRDGNLHAGARRMAIMYVIWNDTMYSAAEQFAAKPYRSSSCDARRSCSATLRHRDHVHISLTRAGGRGLTSWYAGRVPTQPEPEPDSGPDPAP